MGSVKSPKPLTRTRSLQGTPLGTIKAKIQEQPIGFFADAGFQVFEKGTMNVRAEVSPL